MTLMSLFYAAFALLLFGGVGTAIPLDKFYPFGEASNDSFLPPNDDASSTPISLSFPFPFFGSGHTTLFVNNNGLLSFNMGIGQFTPQSFPLGDGRQVIAPFWGDVDTTGTGNVWYRETSDKSLLIRARNEIRAAFVNQMSFEPTVLFIATWDHVGYFRSHTELTNTFQCILITNGRKAFTIFNYADGEIQWTTGDASDGTGGFGGTPAHVGFNAGDGIRFANVPGSQTADIVDIDSTSNVNIPGVWIFRIDKEEIQVTQQCSNESSAPLTTGPRFGNLLGGTAIHLRGPCFNRSDVIKCSFEEGQEISGIAVNSLTAICVSPAFKSTGWKSLTLLIIRDGEMIYRGQSRFYSVFPDESNDITFEQDTLLLDQSSDNKFTIHWDPQSLLPLLDPSSFTVNIALYLLDIDKEELTPFLDVVTGHPNTGTAEFSVPEGNDIEPEVHPVALRISVGPEMEVVGTQGGVSQFFSDIKNYARDNVYQSILDRYYTISQDVNAVDKCIEWYQSQPPNIGEVILNRVPACCETVEKAAESNSGFERDENDALVAYFHPGAASCYRQETITSENMRSGQQCCYDNSGHLITGPCSGGTVDLVAPKGNIVTDLYNKYQHEQEDVIPFIYCCKSKYKSATCHLYYERRPSGQGDSCEPPRPSFTFGDPHMVTMDGFKYTFNGLGEFVLIDTIDGSFTLQGRMIQAQNDTGSPISATSFSAIVAKEFDSDTVQFQLAESEILVDEIDALVNGELLDFEGLPNQQFNNVTLRKSANAISAIFSSGIHLEAKVENGIISVVSTTLPKSYRSLTYGLMGNYNGDESDDLLPRGSSVPLSITSSIRDIHNLFGITWIVNNSNDSLFTYGEGEDWSTYYKPDFVPFFEPVFSDPLLEEQANSICGGDSFCRFDIAVTGRIDIGISTFQANLELERIINNTLPVVCDPPCENGVCVQNDTCSCSEGFSGNTCADLDVRECEANICENGGTCTVMGASTVCTCPEGYRGLLCQESKCPPQCAMEYCSSKLTRKSLCTIPDPVDNPRCNGTCRITYCHTCYYSDKVEPLPEHCDTCPFYPELDQTADNKCFKRWATCTRRAKPLQPRGKRRKTQERFKCFEHPCL